MLELVAISSDLSDLAGLAGLLGINPSSSFHSDRPNGRLFRYRFMNEPTIRWAEPKHPQSNKKTSTKEVLLLAGLAGFEPTNDGIKNRCLTTWRQPNAVLTFYGAYGALGEIRTHDPCLRRAILYPAELQVQASHKK